MSIRVAINGFGRIGRLVFRNMLERKGKFEVVAINDLAEPGGLAHMLKYDTVHGRFPGTVTHDESAITVNGKRVEILKERDPARLPWDAMSIDFAVESTGVFSTRADCMKHVEAGAKRVLLTVPPKDPVDAMVVMGVNDDSLQKEHRVISNASCTTNCLAPLAKVLHDTFGIERGVMTTVHAYTNDQKTADLIHKDLRRARAAAQNIIPTTTGAAKAVGVVIPDLEGKLDGYALRVPVPDGSIVDLAVNLKRNPTVAEVNAALKAAAEGPMQGVLGYTEDPIVSSDVLGDTRSSLVDGQCTMVVDGGKMVKVTSWYDNEWGYSNRVVDLIEKSHAMGSP